MKVEEGEAETDPFLGERDPEEKVAVHMEEEVIVKKPVSPLPPAPSPLTILQSRVSLIIIGYMLCSSTMLIFNKAAVRAFPAPSFLLGLQTSFSAIVIFIGGRLGLIVVDSIEYSKVKAFYLVTVYFIFNIFTNMKALEYCNVETVIVFQTLTSLVIAYGDYAYLGTGVPSVKVMAALGMIVVGALCYVFTDSEFRMDTYFWVFMYFVAKTIDMLYTKRIVDTVPMSSWGRSFYNNFLSMFPLFLWGWYKEKTVVEELFFDGRITTSVFSVVLMSCVIGIGISIVGFMVREAVSATSFSVVGNMNKVLTIFINFVVWDAHASMEGLASLAICLFAGAYYAKVK